VKRFWLESYGCQMNMAEGNAIELALHGAGLVSADSAEDADIAILNTCSVRKSAENRIWGRLGLFAHIKTMHPLVLIVTGCMAQRLLEDMKKEAPQVDYVVPVNDKQKIVDIATGKTLGCHNQTYVFDDSSYHEGEFSSFVPIMNGCDNFCSYCIVPYVRGREVSRCAEDVLSEIRYLDSKGVREITLLGQNVNSYHYVYGDGKVIDFPLLLKIICQEAGNIQWVRFESPHPKDFSDDLIEVIATESKVAKHLHIPLQSGNTRILSLMNRRYTREQFLSLLSRIRARIPQITFAVDVMVGFPSETESEYEDTLSVLDEMGCIEAYMYYFNEREGTRAVSFEGKIDEETKGERLSRLIDFQHRIFEREKTKRLGLVESVLVTQVSRNDKSEMLGRTEHNEMVAFKADIPIGSIVRVHLEDLRGNTYGGTLV